MKPLHSLHRKLKCAEKSYLARNTDERAILLLIRYILMSFFSGDRSFIHAGIKYSSDMLDKSHANGYIRLLTAYLYIMDSDINEAKSILKPIDNYKTYYKNNDPLLYSYFIYVQGYMWYLLDKKKQARKSLDTLLSMEIILLKHNNVEVTVTKSKKATVENPYSQLGYNIYDLSTLYCLIGDLNVYLEDFETAYSFLGRGAKKVDSAISFFGLYNLFSMSQAPIENNMDYKDLFCHFLLRGLPFLKLDSIISKEKDALQRSFIKNPNYMEEIYKFYKAPWLLKELVAHYISKNLLDKKAYLRYKEAEKGQIQHPKLPYFIIKGAMENNIENMSFYFMNTFLGQHEEDLEEDLELKPFIYHILVSDEKMENLMLQREEKILQFACYCLENDLLGRSYNSIYCHLLKNIDKVGLPKNLVKKCEEILFENLFIYETIIENNEVEGIFIFEEEKKNLSSFDVTQKDDFRIASIVSPSSNFNYFSMASNNREIITDDLIFKKQIENEDYFLYKYFYDNGYDETENVKNVNLIIALTNYYLELPDIPDYAVDILNDALYLRDMSNNFRTRITAGLGSILIKQNNLDKAIEYYKVVDENVLSDIYIEQMLLAFLQGKLYQKAFDLLIKKSYCISDDTLFMAVTTLHKQTEIDIDSLPSLSNIAHDLILKSYFDKILVTIILKEYTGSQDEWLALRRALIKNASPILELDEIILYNTIWIHKLDIGSQEIFANLCRVRSQNDLIRYFSIYLCYEILINDKKPVYEAIDSLERIFFNKQALFVEFSTWEIHLFAYSLTHFYLTHSVTTVNSDEIIKKAISFMEIDDIIVPSIKNLKQGSDSTVESHYILKNMPFTYRTSPNRSVTLNYRVDKTDAFTCVPMRYLKFGVYMAVVPHFFSETIEFYFTEMFSNNENNDDLVENAEGSIETMREKVINTNATIIENSTDEFFTINNALIYQDNFKFDLVEEIIYSGLGNKRQIKADIVRF